MHIYIYIKGKLFTKISEKVVQKHSIKTQTSVQDFQLKQQFLEHKIQDKPPK